MAEEDPPSATGFTESFRLKTKQALWVIPTPQGNLRQNPPI